ncbi:MAG TPA: PEGA domain-containing protein, partial [Polyangiaceae bacterium]|nr:PEGA domain-containing protein [Polyangiaceae bacterium]
MNARVLAWFAAASLLPVATAAAKPPAPSARATAVSAPSSLANSLTGQAKADYETAVTLYEDADYAGALLEFERAHQASKDARLLWNMAACEKSLRHYARALGLVERYQREGAGKLTDAQVAEANDIAQTLRALVSTLHVTADQPGATVFVDDQPVGQTPLTEPLVVDLGQHQVRVSKDGFLDQTERREFAGGSDVSLSFSLKPARHEGTVTIRTNRGASIYVDGKLVGESSWDGQLSTGTHKLRVTMSGMQPETREFTLKDAQSRSLELTLKPDKSGLPPLFWVAGGA